jgi:hypothetical protein
MNPTRKDIEAVAALMGDRGSREQAIRLLERHPLSALEAMSDGEFFEAWEESERAATDVELKRLATGGFSEWETGGGCKAWGFEFKVEEHGVTLMVTDEALYSDLTSPPYLVSYELDVDADRGRGGQRYFKFDRLADAVTLALALTKAKDVWEEK